MAPPNPKRPPRPRSGSNKPAEPKKKDVSLPFEDEEIEPLRADDPRPQHVPQLPSSPGMRRGRLDATSPILKKPSDRELSGSFRESEPVSEPGFAPAFLYVERGPGAGQLVPLRQGVLLIGRASTSGLRMQHASISRRHAQLTRRGDRFYVRDLGSQNGTFVNQVRIDKEVEIVAGDDLVMGTAQLKLRATGLGSAAGTSSRVSEVTPRMRRRGPSNTTAVAVTAGAVGFGLAALVMFGIFKLSRGPSYEEIDDGTARSEQPVRAAEERPAAPPVRRAPARSEPAPSGDSPPARPAPAPVTTRPPVEPEPELVREPVRTRPAAEPEVVRRAVAKPPPAPAVKPAPASRPTPVAKAAPARPEPRHPEPAHNEPAPVAGEGAILARYNAGDLSGALSAARARGAKELAGRLTRFREVYELGEASLSRGDQAGAVKALDAALQLDQQLARTPGAMSQQLRRQLSSLYLMQGHSTRDPLAAQRAFARALKYDPENDAARAELERLGGPPPERGALRTSTAGGE